MASNAPDDDFDRAAARAANLTAIYDSQVKAFVEKSSLFEAVFAGYSAEQCRELSKDSRRNLGFTSPTLAYGEIKFESFGTLVLSLTKHEVDLQHMYNFVDLGSGVGKPVIAAAMLGVFDKCSGIELVPELHEAASKALKQYFKSYTGSTMVDYAFLHGDCTYMDWSATDFVFAHASCFDTASLGRISRTASKMKRGSIFVILSNRLLCDDLFTLILTADLEVSWGVATAYVYKRNDTPAPGGSADHKLHLAAVLSKPLPDL